MKLLSVNLSFFRQHRSTELSFRGGVTGVIGANGSGKTTLVEAIAFALFGSRALRGKVEDVRTRGAGHGEETAVSLLFEHEGVTWRVERSLDGGALYQGGSSEAIANGTREVSEHVSGILGMSHEEFLSTYFTEQKGLEFLRGTRGATERERFVIRMMGYDRLERAQEFLRADRRAIKAEIAAFEAGLGTRTDLEAALETQRERGAKTSRAHAEAAAVLAKAEHAAEAAQREFGKLEAQHAEWEHKNRARLEAGVKLQAVEREISEQHRERARITERLAEGPLKGISPADAARRRDEERAALRVLEDRLALSERELHSLEQILERERTRLQTETKLAAAALGKLEAEIREHERVGKKGACPTCGQQLGEGFAHAQNSLRAKRDAEAEKKAALEETAARLKSDARDAGIAAVAETKQALAIKRTLVEALAGAETLAASLRAIDERIARAAAEGERFRALLAAVDGDEQAAKIFAESYAVGRRNHESTSGLLQVARLQKVRAEGELATQQALFGRCERELAAYDERAARLAGLREKAVLLEDGDAVLTGFRKHLNAGIRPRLAELASEFLAELTDGRYTTIEIGADFSPTVVEDGSPKPVISGGEEDIINLCLRLALSQMLAERAGHSFSLLILDEVFGSLDDSRRGNVLLLLEKLSARFEQILIITHLDDVKDGVQNLVYVDYDEARAEVSVGEQQAVPELAVNI